MIKLQDSQTPSTTDDQKQSPTKVNPNQVLRPCLRIHHLLCSWCGADAAAHCRRILSRGLRRNLTRIMLDDPTHKLRSIARMKNAGRTHHTRRIIILPSVNDKRRILQRFQLYQLPHMPISSALQKPPALQRNRNKILVSNP